MKLFLDDCRIPKDCIGYMHVRMGSEKLVYLENWNIVRNYEEFKKFVEMNSNSITHVSFDHDLEYTILNEDDNETTRLEGSKFNEEAKDGYECAKWLDEYYKENNIPLPKIYIHSMNPVGTERIMNIFKINFNGD